MKCKVDWHYQGVLMSYILMKATTFEDEDFAIGNKGEIPQIERFADIMDKINIMDRYKREYVWSLNGSEGSRLYT